MSLRLEYRTIAPGAVKALAGLNAYADGAAIDQRLRRLLEVRVSQVNGCGYCIAVHRRQALALGESAQRLDALERWRSSERFTRAERAALDWAEAVTEIIDSRAPDDAYAELARCYSERELVDLTFVVLAMNAWNRLAISFRREAAGKTVGVTA